MEASLSNFQEKQIDELLEIEENNLETILQKNIKYVDFPFAYIRNKVEEFSNIEKNIFIASTNRMLKNIEEIDYVPIEQITKFVQQLEDSLIVLG